jgi:Peptidase_C39 like family
MESFMQKEKRRNFWHLTVVILLGAVMLSSAFSTPPTTNAVEVERSSSLWMQNNSEDWAGWTVEGIQNSDNALRLDFNNAKSGTDPYGKNGYNGISYYNGGSYRYGEAIAPYYAPVNGFDSAVVSWNANTPPGTWLAVKIRALVNGQWTKEYVMGVWANNSTVKSHSAKYESDNFASLETDTLSLKQPAQAFQVRVSLFSENGNSPGLQRLAVSTLRNGKTPSIGEDRNAWNYDIRVPEKSQMIYPDGGEVWCSPTSLSMVLAYWAQKTNRPELNLDVPAVVARTPDPIYDGWGNWSFNVAFAGTLGLNAYVSRLHSLSQLEGWLRADIPVIASIAYKPGELPGTPITQSDGHLLVIRGFDSNGNVITNDPASDPRKGQSTRVVYPRRAFEQVWQKGSNGTVYIIYPQVYTVPTQKSLGAWYNPQAPHYADRNIEQVWQAADAAVASGNSKRGWLWGPGGTIF